MFRKRRLQISEKFIYTYLNNNYPTTSIWFQSLRSAFCSFSYHMLDHQHNHYLSGSYLLLLDMAHSYDSNPISPTNYPFHYNRNLGKDPVLLRKNSSYTRLNHKFLKSDYLNGSIECKERIYRNNNSSKTSN